MATAKSTAEKLITMVFLKPYGRYSRHDRAGFPADKAKQLEDRKIALPSDKAKAVAAAKAAGTEKPPKGTEGADKV
ncbi:hypothetical protein CZ787_06190 [Halomonas citrativorans]|uniref:Uncharacterized protein n=1 Tax=Halomonas citrativorans TaxID=2742612 RepID=A0A1R4HVH4_9GAMM|nr:hypothetical protein [Halomonas citrativorans]SJN11557.1 hypothetical protein CZ787_06190 [Halomonas citrativorans]